jgi:hypothetical protein
MASKNRTSHHRQCPSWSECNVSHRALWLAVRAGLVDFCVDMSCGCEKLLTGQTI